MADRTAREAFEARLIEKAWKNDTFRQALVTDPRGAVERELGGQLPAGLQVKVLQESADTCYLVLPANPDRAPAGQLTDQQLEAVAGGWTGQTDCITCGGATCQSCGTCAGTCPPDC
jgi:hypothetical protein